MIVSSGFDPARDGWHFRNWGEGGLSWNLFRETYLGINPTYNWAEAPLDCEFYDDMFKDCAEPGNCGGMSLLALALFKYGGYMGFCAPARFYSGDITGHMVGTSREYNGPDRPELNDAVNILQARQFNAPGIQNFLDLWQAGNINDGLLAARRIQEMIGRKDFPVISLANNNWGDRAHTLIPYQVDVGVSTATIWLWDPNYAPNAYPNHYGSTACQLTVNDPQNWRYQPGDASTLYDGAGGGWCFAVPMSLVLRKARHPLTLDNAVKATMQLFVTGSAADVAQIADDQGHRFYKTDACPHPHRSDVETDPARRLKALARWPWFGQDRAGQQPGELYFTQDTDTPLEITIIGDEYRLVSGLPGNVVEVHARSNVVSRDVVRLDGLGTFTQTIAIRTEGEGRLFDVRQLRTGTSPGQWRKLEMRNAQLTRNALTVYGTGNLSALELSAKEGEITAEVVLEQRLKDKLTSRPVGRVSSLPARGVRVAPRDWRALDKTDIHREAFTR